MAETKNREICSCCGQTINRRELVLNKTLVRALVDVYEYCLRNNKYEFARKEVKSIFLHSGTETMGATFGDWIFFSSGLVFKHGRGHWGLNLDRVRLFLQGKMEVATRIAKRNGQSEVEVLERGNVWSVKGIHELCNTAGEIIVNYRQ